MSTAHCLSFKQFRNKECHGDTSVGHGTLLNLE